MPKRKLLFTVTRYHFDNRYFRSLAPDISPELRQVGRLRSVLGTILEIDIGKQVWSVNGTTQVENSEQRDRRLGL